MAPPLPCPTATYHHRPYPAIDPTRPELSAKGKSIVITGGGTGLGAEMARYFAKAGASRILIVARREAPLSSTRDSIKKEYPNVEITSAPVDITKKPDVDIILRNFAKDGKINVLVSNAGVLGLQSRIKDANPDDWFAGIETNVKGSFTVAQSFLDHAAPGAVVINVSSAAWHMDPDGVSSSYGAAKAASLRFFHALALEYPDLKVYNIQPGMVLTESAIEAGFGVKEGEEMTPQKEAQMKLVDEIGLPAAFCVWLASPEAEFLKGKFLWSNWDVEELQARKSELERGLLDFGVIGWPFL